VVADVLRTKALTLIAERATVTDASGNPVDILAITRGDADDEADGDADAEADGEAGGDSEAADAADEDDSA